jgi:hypothetical protein
MAFSGLAIAAHGDVSLPGSFFEIDTDANLKVDHADPWIDWETADYESVADEPSGSNDDSFGEGSKEDTPVPSVVAGSIPPQKSDLLSFGLYVEADGDDRFLHVYWLRVQEPSGTTNMDFEFNQSDTTSANGVTPVRTSGDFLVQYDLAQGGTNPSLFLSVWLDGSEDPPATKNDCEASNKLPCWGDKIDLSAASMATGSINSSAIPASESFGLGDISPRTFGEASLDFDALASVVGGECLTFGSAYLKSRSSDTFNSALKDFIAPLEANVSNCAGLKIIKQDDDGNLLGGVEFEVFADNAPTGGSYDPGPGGEDGTTVLYSCTTATSGSAEGTCTITGILAGSYWVKEVAAPTGYDIAVPSSQPVTIVAGGTETELTFTNDRQPAKVIINKEDDAGSALDGATFQLYVDNDVVGTFDEGDTEVTGKSCTTALGTCTIDEILPPGDYCVDETVVPDGYEKADPQCFDLDLGEELTLADFVDPRQGGAIKITKTRKHAASDTPSADPHEGVEFTITGGGLLSGEVVTTDENGEACFDGLLLSSFDGVGDYTVTETVPANYVADGDEAKDVTVTEASECDDGNEATVAFANTPLTDITVSVDSLVDGGTKSTISCVIEGGAEIDSVDPAQEDPSLTLQDLVPGTYVCTIFVDP